MTFTRRTCLKFAGTIAGAAFAALRATSAKDETGAELFDLHAMSMRPRTRHRH